MKRSVSLAIAVAVAALAAVTGSTVASAAAPEVNPAPRPLYLALGDSLATGQGSFHVTGTYDATVRHWKAKGFVGQFHDTLRDELDCRPDLPDVRKKGCPTLQVVNLSRTAVPDVLPGVTTSTILGDGDQLDQAVAILAERNTDASDRNDVEVISLTVGGNDLFRPAIAACVPLTPECTGTLAVTFQQFATGYTEILATLRAAAGPDVTILTTTYYNPLPYCDRGAAYPLAGPLGDLVLEGGLLPGGAVLEPGFNDLIRAISAQYGAVVADTFGKLGEGDFVGGQDCLHPDASGHAKVADVFAEAFPG